MRASLNSGRNANIRRGVSTPWVITLFWAIGLVMGIVLSVPIGNGVRNLWGGRPLMYSDTSIQGKAEKVVPESQVPFDTLVSRSVAHVQDASSSLQMLILLFTVIVALVGGALGISILKTESYARSFVDKYVCDKQRVLQECADNRREELEAVHKVSLVNLLETYHGVCTMTSESIRAVEEASLKGKGLDDSLVQQYLKEGMDKREAENVISHFSAVCQFCRTPSTEDLVINAAQQLGVLGQRAETVLQVLNRALDAWPQGSRARSELQRVIDRIKPAIKEVSGRRNVPARVKKKPSDHDMQNQPT